MEANQFYDVVFGDRIVLPRLTKEAADILAKQMGEGYSVKPGSDKMPAKL